MEDYEINLQELNTWEKDTYTLIDIRGESAASYGMIPGAVVMSEDEVRQDIDSICAGGRRAVIYCTRGISSNELTCELREQGKDVYSFAGGFFAYLQAKMSMDEQEKKDRLDRIEWSIQKKFHKELFSKFVKAINTYELVRENDHIAVCISGGKDSMLMAKLFQELKRHNKFAFELTFLVMDPGYSEANRKQIEQNAKLMNIPITIYESEIFDAVDNIDKSPCYLCARMRRGHLYSKAKELGCNKIALGHHYDDVIETILMGMLYGGQMQSMMPKLHSTNFEGMELIRPMYLIREDDIKKWRDYNDLTFLQCACHFTENCSSCRDDGTTASKRLETKKLIAQMKKTNPFVEANIFKSAENVSVDTLICYKTKGEKHHFLDTYDEQS